MTKLFPEVCVLVWQILPPKVKSYFTKVTYLQPYVAASHASTVQDMISDRTSNHRPCISIGYSYSCLACTQSLMASTVKILPILHLQSRNSTDAKISCLIWNQQQNRHDALKANKIRRRGAYCSVFTLLWWWKETWAGFVTNWNTSFPCWRHLAWTAPPNFTC